MWRINGSAKTPLPQEEIGKFYGGDCYIILYSYHSGERKEDYFLCCWIGKDSLEVSNCYHTKCASGLLYRSSRIVFSRSQSVISVFVSIPTLFYFFS